MEVKSRNSEGKTWDRGGDREHKRETYGPLCIKRSVKEDGRALILYSHTPQGRGKV